jgi:hypothetical protein
VSAIGAAIDSDYGHMMLTIKKVKKATPDKTTNVQVIKLTGEMGGLVVRRTVQLKIEKGLINRYALGPAACGH